MHIHTLYSLFLDKCLISACRQELDICLTENITQYRHPVNTFSLSYSRNLTPQTINNRTPKAVLHKSYSGGRNAQSHKKTKKKLKCIKNFNLTMTSLSGNITIKKGTVDRRLAQSKISIKK